MPCYWGQAEPGLCCGGGCGDAHGKSHKQAGGRGWQGASPSTEVGKGDWNKHMRFCASGKEGVGNAAPRGVENRWLFSPESAAALRHQFSSVAQSCLTLCDPMNRSTPGLPVHHQLPEFNQHHQLKLMSIESVMPSSHLILCRPLLLLPLILPSIKVFSSESTLRMRWPKYWSFSFNISPSKEIPGLISFRMDRWISLQSKGLSRVFYNTTLQNHQFFGA